MGKQRDREDFKALSSYDKACNIRERTIEFYARLDDGPVISKQELLGDYHVYPS